MLVDIVAILNGRFKTLNIEANYDDISLKLTLDVVTDETIESEETSNAHYPIYKIQKWISNDL